MQLRLNVKTQFSGFIPNFRRRFYCSSAFEDFKAPRCRELWLKEACGGTRRFVYNAHRVFIIIVTLYSIHQHCFVLSKVFSHHHISFLFLIERNTTVLCSLYLICFIWCAVDILSITAQSFWKKISRSIDVWYKLKACVYTFIHQSEWHFNGSTVLTLCCCDVAVHSFVIKQVELSKYISICSPVVKSV